MKRAYKVVLQRTKLSVYGYRRPKRSLNARHRTDCNASMRQPDPLMHWRPTIPRKATLVVLFKAAQRRLTKKTDGVVELPNARIITATKDLNQITDDIRGAQEAPEEAPSAIPKKPPLVISTVGKILRRPPR